MGGEIPASRHSSRIATAQLLRTLLPEALKEWGQLLQDMDAEYLQNKASGKFISCSVIRPLPDDYKNPDSWPADREDDEVDDEMPEGGSASLIRTLGWCSWCGRASAALRKCRGCSMEKCVALSTTGIQSER